MNLKKLAALALCLCMIFAVSACNSSEEGGEKETLTLGTSADYPPYEFHVLDEKGNDVIVGFDISLAQKIAEDMGKELVIKDMNFEYVMQELDAGNVDMVIASIAPTPERLAVSDFSDAYYQDPAPMMLVRAEDKDIYTSLDSLSGKTIGVQTATTKCKQLEETLPDSPRLELAAVPDLINNLMAGKCDAVYVDGGVALGYAESTEEIVIAEEIQIAEGDVLGVAVKKGDPNGLLESINKTIAENLENGKLDEWLKEAEELSASALE